MKTRIEYTPLQLDDGTIVRRPYIDVVVGYQGEHTPPLEMIVDTGADYCLLDWTLATSQLGFDPSVVGTRKDIGGIGNVRDAYVVPVSIRIRRLNRTFEVEAYFCHVSLGIFGLLGHIGFLEHFECRFDRAKHFIITDDTPAPVVRLNPAT